MKVSRRLVLRCSGAAAALMALAGCTGTSGAALGSGLLDWFRAWLRTRGAADGTVADSSAFPAEPSVPYEAGVLTGMEDTGTGRIVGVMVNNIANSARQNARPQRGIGSAELLIESRVEGGITRLCAVYQDAAFIPEVGPIRSGRDHFLQLLMPWQGLYYHDGESIFCTQFVSVYDYSGLNIGGKSDFNTPTHPHLAHRDSRGRDVAYEHTEFTSGREIRTAAANAGIGLEYPYEETFFRFADYRTGAQVTLLDAAEAGLVHIAHSDKYQTELHYQSRHGRYALSMYDPSAGVFAATIDELDGTQLLFDNVLVCFAAMDAYAGDSHDVQEVQFVRGGQAYLFTRGRVQPGHWEKPHPTQPLRLYAEDGQEMTLNRGKTYLALVDEDEWNRFFYQ